MPGRRAIKAGVRYFSTPDEFRSWLREHHRTAAEVHVGFFKRRTGQPSLTWPQSVAEALCYGWIDGVRRRVDGDRYSIRFTPRKPGSTWSRVNIRLMAELEAAGRVTAAGRATYKSRVAAKSRTYSYEQKTDAATLDAARLRTFKNSRAAWMFFAAQPPGYRKKAAWWVVSAKQEATRSARFTRLLQSSAAGKRLA